ncbi:hypothetical protein ACROYT_G012825 [Oculina patagonica]
MKMSIFLVFCMMLLFSMNLEVKGACQPNGCSIPFNMNYFYKRLFTPACNKHDVCYACGVDNGWSQFRCDLAFRRDMYSLCRRKYSTWYKRLPCYAIVGDYYAAVRTAGWFYYENPSLSWCNTCPSSKGDPYVYLRR